jgi:nicastrin
LPIGGYSVVATAPPMWGRTDGPHAGKSVILVIARLDANGLFRDATPAVNARMTGLVALMAAAKSTQKMFKEMDAEDVAHPVAFLALSGEDFGKLGSERIAREMLASTETSQLPGLAGKKIRAIIELGPLGFSESFVGERVPTIYVHGAHEGKMLERIEKIANTFEFEETAALGVPRILETAAPTFEALLANEYETAYLSEDPDAPIDELSGTTLDAGSFRAIDAERMETVVHVIARLVRALATNDKVDAPRLDVEGGKLAVKELAKCLTNENYGLERCELGKKFLYGEEASAPGLGESFVDPVALPSRYPDALQGLSRDMQSHEDKNALARFVWNYLADATSNTVSPKMCEGDGSCAENTVCVGRTPMSVGECHAATSKYMLALSTRLAFDRSTGLWIVNEPKDDVERAAPLWTESDWSPAIGATLVAPVKYNFFTSVDAFLLYGVICLMLVVAAQFCFDRDKKRGGAREREALLRGAQP